jgi:flagellar hook assembly protein FlgD
MTFGIKQISSEISDKYLLEQNYPNPFNPSTNIRYQIKNNTNVILKIYDISGKEIITLVNEKQNSGTYEVTFDGSELSSGVYYYKLTTGDFSVTKKMILIK